jgi:uncharacterized membrane protein
MERGIGDFVVTGEALVSVSGGPEMNRETDRVNRAYYLGQQRTLNHDVAFGIRQMVDVAVKALSPGINDTTTAIVSVDRLSAVLARMAQRRLNAVPLTFNGRPKLIPREPVFASYVDTAFNEIRRNAASNVNVLARLLRAVEVVASFTRSAERLNHLRVHVDRIADVCTRSVEAPVERAALEQQCARLRRKIDCAG